MIDREVKRGRRHRTLQKVMRRACVRVGFVITDLAFEPTGPTDRARPPPSAAAVEFLRGYTRVAVNVRVHLSILLGILALIVAWGYRIDAYDLLFS